MRHKEQIDEIVASLRPWFDNINERILTLDSAFDALKDKSQIKGASESSVAALDKRLNEIINEMHRIRNTQDEIVDSLDRFKNDLRAATPVDIANIVKEFQSSGAAANRMTAECIDVKSMFAKLFDKVQELGQLARRN